MELLLFVVVLLLAPTPSSASQPPKEDFAEALILKPLPDRKLLAHFHFRTTAPPSPSNGLHHRLFPKAIAQLIRKFGIREMELSFTQGRWNYERWGASDPVSCNNAKPPGVELWTAFDLPVGRINSTWRDLTHALSGLFCSSINFLESSTAYAAPRWALKANSGNLRYGSLPREAVCTENLTPWLKLLPCRDKAGIASLLDRPSIYKGFYHSQRLRLASTESNGMVIEQTLTVVLHPSSVSLPSLQPNWSIGSLFKRKVGVPCVLAKSSRVFIEFDNGLVAELEKVGPGGLWNSSGFELSRSPDNLIWSDRGSVLYQFDILNRDISEAFDIGFSWKHPFVWSCTRAPLQANRFLMGSGNERGSVAIRLMAAKTPELFQGQEDGCSVDVSILQIVPWYVKVYYHTLKIVVDGKAQDSSVIEKLQVSPSEDKLSPGVMELMLKLPCKVKSAVLTVDFDKGFLHIDEYPPDANQGFDIPSAIVGFPNFTVTGKLFEESFTEKHDLFHSLEERSTVRSYTEILLVPLTTPDFSMPYNVITFTCTVLALYFGSLLNVLRRRVGEEERLLSKGALRQGLLPQLLSKLTSKIRRGAQDPSATSSSTPSSSLSFLCSKQLLRTVLVALAAVLWYYFQNEQ